MQRERERERLTLVQPSSHHELQPFNRDFHSLRTAQHSGVIKELQVVVRNRMQALLCAPRNSDMTLLSVL